MYTFFCRIAFINETSSVRYTDALLKQGENVHVYNLDNTNSDSYAELQSGEWVITTLFLKSVFQPTLK